ncbi:hypothetical protein AB0G04_08165 [Actinoplanes sp. NPDC023801]|uniref:hypothetical protein n=1 Tax=Actinoplanes sp. NPDC023801 TaxID=3154595 RepID=UPI00340B43BA
MWNRLVAVLSCAVVLTGCTGQTGTGTATTTPSPAVASPAIASPAGASPAAGRSFQARWWEWAAAEPESTNPVADLTGEHCARNQPGDVWFLAGSFGGQAQRRCTVPAGVPLVVPGINLVGSDRADCRAYMADASATIELDGAKLRLDRVEHEPIMFTAAPSNPVTETAGEHEGQGCGLWARIEPLRAGEHEIRIRGRSGSFSLDVKYTLLVKSA